MCPIQCYDAGTTSCILYIQSKLSLDCNGRLLGSPTNQNERRRRKPGSCDRSKKSHGFSKGRWPWLFRLSVWLHITASAISELVVAGSQLRSSKPVSERFPTIIVSRSECHIIFSEYSRMITPADFVGSYTSTTTAIGIYKIREGNCLSLTSQSQLNCFTVLP